MKNEVLFVLFDAYADWEGAYLSTTLLDQTYSTASCKYSVKTVAPTNNPVISLGGFKTLPDYSFENMPKDYAALVIVGGYGLDSDEAQLLVPIVKDAINKGIIVGGICNGASFLAAHGFLNNVKHTGNGVEQLKKWGGKNYTNEKRFQECQAYSDGGIVTANGTGALEFAREMLLLLKPDEEKNIIYYYNFQKNGFYQK